jgi:hypothetical protein
MLPRVFKCKCGTHTTNGILCTWCSADLISFTKDSDNEDEEYSEEYEEIEEDD